MHLAKSTSLLISPAPSQVVRAYGGGGGVHLLGKVQEAEITLNNNTSSGEILVTHDSKPILGMDFYLIFDSLTLERPDPSIDG